MTYEQFLQDYWRLVCAKSFEHEAELCETLREHVVPFDMHGDGHAREIAARIFMLPVVAYIFGGAYELHDGGKYVFLTHVWDGGPRGRGVVFAIKREVFTNQETIQK